MRKSSGSKTDKKTRRTGKLVYCKHRCGHKYERRSGEKFDKKKRDAFDYHERARCTNLPFLMCLVCSASGHAKMLKGRANLSAHNKTLKHLRKARQIQKTSSDVWLGQIEEDLMMPVVEQFFSRIAAYQASPNSSPSVSPVSSPISSPISSPAKKRSFDHDELHEKKARILAEESEPSDEFSEGDVLSSPALSDHTEYIPGYHGPEAAVPEEYLSPGHAFPENPPMVSMNQYEYQHYEPASFGFGPEY